MKTTCKVSFEAHDSDGCFRSIGISVVFHLLSSREELSGMPRAPRLSGGRLSVPAPNQKGLGWHKLAHPFCISHLRTYVDDSPLQIPHKGEGEKKRGQETVNITVITLRQNIPSVHCKKRVKAKLKRRKKKQTMLHELQCNRIIPSLSIFLPPALFSLEKGLSTTQSGKWPQKSSCLWQEVTASTLSVTFCPFRSVSWSGCCWRCLRVRGTAPLRSQNSRRSPVLGLCLALVASPLLSTSEYPPPHPAVSAVPGTKLGWQRAVGPAPGCGPSPRPRWSRSECLDTVHRTGAGCPCNV